MRNRDIIKQYVNTGKILPKYQLYKLNNSLLKSYFRKRSQTMIIEDVYYKSSTLYKWYEFIKLDENQRNLFIDNMYKDFDVSDYDFETLGPDNVILHRIIDQDEELITL